MTSAQFNIFLNPRIVEVFEKHFDKLLLLYDKTIEDAEHMIFKEEKKIRLEDKVEIILELITSKIQNKL